MPFRYLPDVALADVAFEATSGTLDGLFEECGRAVTDVMVDPRTLRSSVTRKVSLDSADVDRLLYDYLTELIVLKDVDSLLFHEFQVRVSRSQRKLDAVLRGEPIDRGRHLLRNDAKAVTMHLFGVKHGRGFWKATVVLDI